MATINIMGLRKDACSQLHEARKNAANWRLEHGADYQIDGAIHEAEAALKKLRKIRKHLKGEGK